VNEETHEWWWIHNYDAVRYWDVFQGEIDEDGDLDYDWKFHDAVEGKLAQAIEKKVGYKVHISKMDNSEESGEYERALDDVGIHHI
jgi:hypothetical protein